MPPRIEQIGQHIVEISDDLVVTRMLGDFTLDDIKAYYALLSEVSKDKPIYAIANISQGGSITPEARRYAIANGKMLHLRCNVIFGMNAIMRALLILLGQAAKIVRKGAPAVQTVFVANEDDAMAYVHKLRAGDSSGSSAAGFTYSSTAATKV
jgi:hypothetical protein